MILDDIIAKKRIYLDNIKEFVTEKEVREHAERLTRRPAELDKALKRNELSIIAEIKKASPSRGVIRRDFHPGELAYQYSNCDVQVLSVLTETDYFQGGPYCLQEARKISHLPLLRKDFIIEEYQIYEAYILGADAILLIAAVLDDKTLDHFRDVAGQLGMSCLLEVHDGEELKRALALDFPIIGINNRNLYTFEENLKTTALLAEKIPANKVIVSESGMKTAADVSTVRGYGADAVLIGEMFMRAPDIGQAIRDLRGSL